MIVRIQGEGQFELDDDEKQELEKMDAEMFKAIDSGDGPGFEATLKQITQFIAEKGDRVPDDQLKPSDAIVPSSDTSLEEAKRLFSDEGYLTPVEA